MNLSVVVLRNDLKSVEQAVYLLQVGAVFITNARPLALGGLESPHQIYSSVSGWRNRRLCRPSGWHAWSLPHAVWPCRTLATRQPQWPPRCRQPRVLPAPSRGWKMRRAVHAQRQLIVTLSAASCSPHFQYLKHNPEDRLAIKKFSEQHLLNDKVTSQKFPKVFMSMPDCKVFQCFKHMNIKFRVISHQEFWETECFIKHVLAWVFYIAHNCCFCWFHLRHKIYTNVQL